MRQHPQYRAIVERLAGPLDGTHFEQCAVELLAETYPSLTPVPGGNDAGMDGVIDEDTFLVVTTAEDFSRNLTRSLDRQLAVEGLRRRVVFATSREITPPQWQKLEAGAAEKGFTLINVHARDDFAARLYRSSKWARDLLGVTGDPPSLSVLPSGRLLLRDDLPLIGRDADLQWLRDTRGDRVLVGQPGSGKTHLLLALVREGGALFLASDDETKIANDLRDLQPEIVLVDDAHVEPGRLQRLRRLRQEINQGFDILAAAWPGYESDVVSALGHVCQDNVRELDGLTRIEIAQVLRTIGIQAPDDDPWFGFLVDQALNRPGLAVLLGELSLRGEGRDVLSGKALSRSLIPALQEVLGSDPIRLLACFAVGGDAGMRLTVVADYLGIGLDLAHAQATAAAHGGVLESIERGRLAVQPWALRSALLAEVFFSGTGLDHELLVEQAMDPGDAVEAIVAAAHAGAEVPREELRRLVVANGTEIAWQGLATLDESQGSWVLRNYPGELVDVARAVLKSAPRKAIEALLRLTPPGDEPLHSRPRHPLRVLQDWIEEIPFKPGSDKHVRFGESLQRRRLLVDEVAQFIENGGDRDIALRAGLLALTPVLESHRESYTGASVSLRRGYLPASMAPEIHDLWHRLLPKLPPLTGSTWRALSEVLHQWTYPWVLGMADDEEEFDEEERASFRSVAARIIEDVQGVEVSSPALALALSRWTERIGATLSITVDEDLAVLFPSEDHMTPDNWKEEEEHQRQAAGSLAHRWAADDPAAVIAKLVRFHDEARAFDLQDEGALFAFYRTLAADVESPEQWLQAALRYELDPRWTAYFLSRLVEERRNGWEALLKECLHTETYAWLAADETIRAHDLSADLLEQAIEKVPPHLVHTSCLRGQIAVPVLKRLLSHPRREVAEAAADALWAGEPRGEVPAELEAEWRDVVLTAGRGGGIDRSRQTRSWLKRLLARRPDLALAWLRQRFADVGELEIVSEDGVYSAAIGSLGVEERKKLVEELKPDHFGSRLIRPLVGSLPDVYRSLLSRKELADRHLDPLKDRVPDAQWAEMAQVALDAGHSPEKVASAALWPPFTKAGYGEEHWQRWLDFFEELGQTAEGPLQGVVELGASRAAELKTEAAANRRRFELTGRF